VSQPNKVGLKCPSIH